MSAPMATPDRARRRTVLTMEQALSMSYATLRFVHLGWRVIRLEPTPVKGRRSKGDPNRYIGRETPYGEDRHSYFIAPNVGKEAVALNLKEADGRALVRRMVRELPVDIFCTNTLPGHHRDLGIDYDTLRAERDELIWCSISAQGTDYPDVPGYDPVIQAQCGFMDLTGDADGPPLQCGPPVTDLKAGDEAFAQVLLALMERAETGKGKRIDISMAHGALSWMHTFLPMLDMGTPPSEIRRSGNAHRQFIPTNAYATRDGYIYMAIGGDPQWQRLVATPMFRSLDQPRFAGNEGRRKDKVELHGLIEGLTREHPTAAIAEVLTSRHDPAQSHHPHRGGDGPALRKEPGAAHRRPGRPGGAPSAAGGRHPVPRDRGGHAAVRPGLRRAHRRHPLRPGCHTDRDRQPARTRRGGLTRRPLFSVSRTPRRCSRARSDRQSRERTSRR